MTNKITADEVKAEALKLAAAHPRKKNPTRGLYNSCIYTDKYRKRHCIAGQIMVNLGTDLCPTYTSKANEGMSVDEVSGVRFAFTDDAIVLMNRLQLAADGAMRSGPLPWGEAVASVVGA